MPSLCQPDKPSNHFEDGYFYLLVESDVENQQHYTCSNLFDCKAAGLRQIGGCIKDPGHTRACHEIGRMNREFDSAALSQFGVAVKKEVKELKEKVKELEEKLKKPNEKTTE